ncbi:DCBD1 protein, partial [Amia calva]|nr:DCBD1 protein [Amia calva]
MDIEAQHCESDFVKIFKGTKAYGNDHVYGTFCGTLDAHPREIHVDSSEITVQFQSGHHISGRGFLLSYASGNHEDLLTCLDRASHFLPSKYRKYCPAGCKTIAGEISGDISQGYRHTSVLCKAAVHAGVILDEIGGQISVEQHRGLSHYEGIKANGIQSKDLHLSQTPLMFSSFYCKKHLSLTPVSITASSSWQRSSELGQLSDWSPNNTQFDVRGRAWAADHNNSRQFLFIDLGERKKITGIITTGSTLSHFDFYVKSYKIEYREKNKWRTYTQNSSAEDMIFEGNLDYLHQSRNSFLPPIVARQIRIIPQSWHQRIAMKMELLGCPQVKAITLQPTQGNIKPNTKSPGEDENAGPIPTQADLVKLLLIVVPAIGLLVLLLVGICVYRALQKKKTKETAYGSSDAQKTGCWKQIKQPFTRHQSAEFTISYSSDKDTLQKLDLVTCSMADYQQPLMIGTGTVTRKGSTFKPMDTDTQEEQLDTGTHYDYLHTANQYALPLTNQEPEYATPIIERHNFRKDVFLHEVGYNVPAVALNKTPSFKSNECSSYRKDIGLTGGYQTPHVRAESLQTGEGGYDRPKLNIAATDYHKPQATPPVTESYSIPRDCLKLTDSLQP